jgi:hypothetical protein
MGFVFLAANAPMKTSKMRNTLTRFAFLGLTLASLALVQGCDDDDDGDAQPKNAWLPADFRGITSPFGGGSSSGAGGSSGSSTP